MTPIQTARHAKFSALDYTKTNSELARSLGMTPGAVAFWRKKFGHPNGGIVSWEERFFSFVDKTSSPHGCWLWTGGITGGYGIAWQNNKSVRASRFSWILHNGPIPDELHVLHDYPGGDNRACVNPSHLWLGTCDDNMKDKVHKGRQARGKSHGWYTHPEMVPRGERNQGAKLKAEQVVEVRRLGCMINMGGKYRIRGEISALAKQFGITTDQVRRIISRKNWKHVP